MEENSQTPLRNSTVEQGNQGWVYYKELDPIPENLLGLNVCTLDFKVKPRYTVAELPEDRAFLELIRNPELIKEDFLITPQEIPTFLSNLEEATGGKGTFRYLTVDTPLIKCDHWRLKFLNLYISPLHNGFIVCNRVSKAIRWREIIPHIDYKKLGYYNSRKQE